MKTQYKLKEISKIPEVPGIYLFKGKNDAILYIGKAKNLKKRVKSHFQKDGLSWKSQSIKDYTVAIDIVRLSSEFEALLAEANLIRTNKPKYNAIWKDDKHYIYILITKEEFPKIRFARKKDEKLGYFYGPYPSSSVVKDLISLTRRIIPFCTQKSLGKKSCFYTHIGLCNPCPSSINLFPSKKREMQKDKYRHNIKLVRLIFEGKIKKLEKYLINQMDEYKKRQLYENAAIYRDRLKNLEKIVSHFGLTSDLAQIKIEDFNAMEIEANELKKELKNNYPNITRLDWLECYDISNIQGKQATGSMVTFYQGSPYKYRYRRFKIRFASRPDDFAMIKEVFTRRFSHPEWNYPDLIVIDGGKGQVSSALSVLKEKKIDVPIIGLAKRL
ncbi:GIY-YIG nuclease family protein, partial [Candidatus Gottesmanbacteria bacterium]|nr:GIY-YIG nuclease family protein [Candidatus Gottesmanbacteria bacterium]